jgi:hypothetical protein
MLIEDGRLYPTVRSSGDSHLVLLQHLITLFLGSTPPWKIATQYESRLAVGKVPAFADPPPWLMVV